MGLSTEGLQSSLDAATITGKKKKVLGHSNEGSLALNQANEGARLACVTRPN